MQPLLDWFAQRPKLSWALGGALLWAVLQKAIGEIVWQGASNVLFQALGKWLGVTDVNSLATLVSFAIPLLIAGLATLLIYWLGTQQGIRTAANNSKSKQHPSDHSQRLDATFDEVAKAIRELQEPPVTPRPNIAVAHFSANGAFLEGNRNIGSLTDLAQNDYMITFATPLDVQTLVVHPIGATPRPTITGYSANSVSVSFDQPADQYGLRFDSYPSEQRMVADHSPTLEFVRGEGYLHENHSPVDLHDLCSRSIVRNASNVKTASDVEVRLVHVFNRDGGKHGQPNLHLPRTLVSDPKSSKIPPQGVQAFKLCLAAWGTVDVDTTRDIRAILAPESVGKPLHIEPGRYVATVIAYALDLPPRPAQYLIDTRGGSHSCELNTGELIDVSRPTTQP